jgi:glycosyltransferase involved in cell wall biosynthesis
MIMKITLLSTSDSAGGAAIACIRLAEALLTYGHTVRVLVMEKKTSHTWIHEVAPARKQVDGLLKDLQYAFNQKFQTKSGLLFSGNPWWGHQIHRHPAIVEADIINLHWINHGFLGLHDLQKLFALNKPVTWHLHDFWAFTGGCHYPANCENFVQACGSCPALKNKHPNDLSSDIWQQKAAFFAANPPMLVGASAWLTEQAAKSGLARHFRAVHIPNPINTAYYHPTDKAEVRKKLGLALNETYLLFAAMNTADVRKGFEYLKHALVRLKKEGKKVQLLIAGKCAPDTLAALPFEGVLLGSLGPDAMRMAYQAADLFVIPSLEENLPNTILESLACGTPVVGFDTGGIPEMVKPGINGALAATADADSLAAAIDALLDPRDRPSVEACTTSVAAYAPAQVAEQYTRIFTSLISAKQQVL